MPQDSLRSVVYRSLVPCDNPNGVVEHSTIKKSKTGSGKMKQKIESRRVQRTDSNQFSAYKQEKELVSERIKEELQIPPPFQLWEVSRGAQKLKQMVDLMSKGISLDGKSKDIARDLLKGALDLQESLIMLGKLQETSEHMARLKRKQKSRYRQGGESEVGIERMDLDQFTHKNHQMEWQNPQLPADDSSRTCIEELKRVIRDSLSRQNLLAGSSINEKTSLDRKKTDLASTSSSRSSLIQSKDSACSSSSTVQHKKAKGHSLIAKLMGLDDLSSEPIHLSLKQLDSEKILNQQRPAFDIDMPKARKFHIVNQNVDPERKTLKEIIETMQLKGLLKYNSSKQRLNDEIPPIVIIKPLQFPCIESEEILSRRSLKEEAKVEFCTEKLIQEEGAKEDVKGLKAKEKTSSIKVKKASVSTSHESRKKAATNKQTEKTTMVSPERRKPAGKSLKPAAASRSPDQAKASSTKLRKIGNVLPITTKNREPLKESSLSSTHSKQTLPRKSTDQIKRIKEMKPKRARESMRENFERKEDKKEINRTTYDLDSCSTSSKLLADQLLKDEGTKVSEAQIEDRYENDQNSFCEVIPQTSQHERIVEPAEEVKQIINQKITKGKSFAETDLKGLLLSSPSFFNYAEELFDLDVNRVMALHTVGLQDHPLQISNTRLFLDCANEIMDRKSVQRSPRQHHHHPLQINFQNLRIAVSLDQLVEEVCDGIENLRSHSKFDGNGLPPMDSLYTMLERDLTCNCKTVMVSGVWDSGWMNGFSSVDETDQVVVEVEKHVLGGMIEEVIIDLVL